MHYPEPAIPLGEADTELEAEPLLADEMISPYTDIDTPVRPMSTGRKVSLFVVAGVAVLGVAGVAHTSSASREAPAAVLSSSASDDGETGCSDGMDDTTYFQCPPGAYLSMTAEERDLKNQRLQALQDTLAKLGRVPNDRESYMPAWSSRGYATYESSVWAKPEECQTLVDEDWTKTYNEYYYQYQPDHAPDYITKFQFTDYPFEFHDNWKVASTSFSSYFPCEYGDKNTVSMSTDVPDGYNTVAAVRNPISRFVSGVGELLQRSMNHYCPAGYCTSKDSFDNTTLDWLTHQTTWYPTLCDSTEVEWDDENQKYVTVNPCDFDYDKFTEIVSAFVHDKKCNYYFYAAEHFVSQSAFVTQNLGCAAPLDTVIQLENLDDGLEELADKMGKKMSCDMGSSNSATDKPGGLPSESETMAILEKEDDLMKELCLIYAQDFICFDYDLPDACDGMF